MKFSFFNGKKETVLPKEKATDSFADSLSLDFKRAAIEEVLNQLHLSEGKYLSSILKTSYFPIEHIIFHPLDKETALETEEFFRIHSEITPNFEDSFFANILLREYRTEHGAKALLKKDCAISIHPGIHSFDDPTNEESYQISLRGNRKKMGVTVKLGTLKPNETSAPPRKAIPANNFTEFGNTNQATKPIPLNSNSKKQLALQISDAHGERQLICSIPTVIGREVPNTDIHNMQKIDISAMYISRQQLNLFELNNTIFAFIPKDAKLTGIAKQIGILDKLHLYEINDEGLEITFGQPVGTQNLIVDANTPNLYPTVSIKPAKDFPRPSPDSTPIPNIKA